MKSAPKIVFKREEVRSINNAYTECPYDQKTLDDVFRLDVLNERVKASSMKIDCWDRVECGLVFNSLGQLIKNKEKEEARLKKR